MRTSESELLAAQRAKVEAIQKAARASGDSELLRFCTLALEEGSSTFDTMISWAGGRVAEGNHQTRVHVPAAEQYVILYSDRSGRWVAGEVGASLPNGAAKYDVMLALEESRRPPNRLDPPWMRGPNELRRVFYFHAEEIAPFIEQKVSAASGLWTVLIDGKATAGTPAFAGESEQEAVATWKRHTKSRTPLARLSAIPRAAAGQGPSAERQLPARVIVLVASAESAIGLTQAVETRLEEGDRVPFEDFYTSSRFRKSLAYARTLVEEKRIRLLSACYGLSHLWGWHTRATSDDVPLDQLNMAELKDWAWRINHELSTWFAAERHLFVVLAGPRYVQALREGVPEGVQWTFEEGNRP